MYENKSERIDEDEDIFNINSNHLAEEGEDCISNFGNKDSLITQSFLLQNKEASESDSSFSENLFNKKDYQKMDTRILENINRSLKYLKNLEKEELISLSKFTLSSSFSN